MCHVLVKVPQRCRNPSSYEFTALFIAAGFRGWNFFLLFTSKFKNTKTTTPLNNLGKPRWWCQGFGSVWFELIRGKPQSHCLLVWHHGKIKWNQPRYQEGEGFWITEMNTLLVQKVKHLMKMLAKALKSVIIHSETSPVLAWVGRPLCEEAFTPKAT